MHGVLLDPVTGRPAPELERLVPAEVAESLRRSRLLGDHGPRMMADFPLRGDGQYAEKGEEHPGGLGLAGPSPVTGGSNNTKGAWMEVFASTSHNASGILIYITPASGGCVNSLIDIGIGASGSEQVLIPNLMYLQGIDGSNSPFANAYYFNIRIPAGSRLSARVQSSTAGHAPAVGVTVFGTGMMPSAPLQRVTAYGANTGSSKGTVLDPGGTAHTPGAWTQLSASTTAPIRELVLSLGHDQDFSTGGPGYWWEIDIGVGASGSEVIVIPKLGCRVMNDYARIPMIPSVYGPLPAAIPAGSRIAARAVSYNATSSPDRTLNVLAYGVD